MFRRIVILAMGGFFVSVGGSAAAAAAPQTDASKTSPVRAVQVPGTSLLVSLPAGWEIGPARPGGIGPTGVQFHGEPGFDVTAVQNDKTPHAEAVMSLPFECDFLFGALQAASKFQLAERPDFIPADYYSRVLVPPSPKQGDVLTTCLYLGSSAISLMIRPAPQPADGSKLTPLLQAIANSGRQRSTLLYAPGPLKLPVLQVTASMSSGIWAAGSTSLPGSGEKRDLLVRISGSSELKILPRVSPGPCSLEGNPNRRKAPPYVSAKWEPSAWEMPKPNNQLQILVCRQIAPTKMLLVSMAYGAPEVPANEAAGIARALDEIAEAIKTGQP